MKYHTNSFSRTIYLVCLFAVGVATTIATGGSGGSSSGGSNGGPPPPPPDMIALTAANAHDVASTLVVAIGLGFDIGDLAPIDIGGQAVGAGMPLLELLRADNVVSKTFAPMALVPEDCPLGGTVDVTAVLADPNTLTVGDQITAIFVDCDDGDGYAISGTIDLTVSAIQGDYATGVFLLAVDVLMTDVEITEDSEIVTVQGDFTLTMDSLAFPVIDQTIEGAELSLESGPETIVFSNFDHFIRVDFGMSPEAVFVTAIGQLDSVLLGGAIDYETPVPIQAIGDEDPYTGEILVSGANNSTIRIVIHDSTSITLEVDENGDGVVDAFIDTTFAALNGYTSIINSSTAVPVAGEAHRVVTGYGSMSFAPGGLFRADAPFGQLRLTGLSGNFGPLDVNCVVAGTASVSGSIAVANTYTSGDVLHASFSSCARGGEVLNGEVGFIVTSYDQTPDDAFIVSGAVTQTGLERSFGGFTFTGNGELLANYDFGFTTLALVQLNTESASFALGFDGVDRTMSDASVSSQIGVMGGVPLLNRFSSGRFEAPALGETFDYQSIAADITGPETHTPFGPIAGELKVTASDGSSVTVVAVDSSNVRLDVDSDGNGYTDTEINTTWEALQQ